jgi:hypothetical protein
MSRNNDTNDTLTLRTPTLAVWQITPLLCTMGASTVVAVASVFRPQTTRNTTLACAAVAIGAWIGAYGTSSLEWGFNGVSSGGFNVEMEIPWI